MMPNLPNMGVERDLFSFKEFFENSDFRTDGLKIYPTLVIRGTQLYEMWKKGIYKNPITSLDLVPTFVELAGGKITNKDKLDGVNIFPYITNEIEGLPHQTMMWRFTISAGIRKGNWKLVRLPDRIPLLFNLDNDPSEQDNVALKNMDLVKSMLKELGDWDVSTPHILFLEGARWRRNQLDLYDKQYQLEQP